MSIEEKVPERVLRILKSLLDFKADAIKRDSIHEMENAAARISELLLKYNLELEEIEFKDKEKTTKEDVFYLQRKNENDWEKVLWHTISRYNLCEVVTSSKRLDNGTSYIIIYLIGKEVNREIVKYTVNALNNEIRRVEPNYWKTYFGFDKRNAFRRGFFLGCVRGIKYKLESEKNLLLSQNNKITALVRTNQIELANKIQEFFPDVVTSNKKRRASAVDGYTRGFNHGKNMEIQKGVGEKQKNLIGE